VTRRRHAAAPLRVAWFGTYDRGVGRNAILIDGLRASGAEVVELHAPLWSSTDAKVAAVAGRGSIPLLRLAARQFGAWFRLARQARRLGRVDAVVVGPTAHLDLPLARRVARRRGAVLVFDPLISASETARDRGVVAAGSLRARTMRAVERWLFGLPDVVLVDTAAHGRALAADVGLDPERAVVLPVGAPAVYREATPAYTVGDPSSATGGAATKGDASAMGISVCRVVYCGQYIPLHGVATILAAAHALRERSDIKFELVGLGQGLAAARAQAEALELPNVRFVEAWLPPAELAARHLAPADVCLGIFGTSPKAAVVVPHKAYMALAAGRALVTGDTPAARELLRPGEAMLVAPGDAVALAAALVALADDPGQRARLAERARAGWFERFSPEVLGAALADILAAAVRVHRAPRMVGPRHRWRTARLGAALRAAAPAGDLLDAGCGDGSLALALAGSAIDGGAEVVLACDIDRRRVRLAADRARARGLGCRVLPFVADVAALPLADGTLAGAAAGEVLEHVRDDAAAVRELARVLVPGGVLAVTVPAGPARFGALDRDVGHMRRYEAGSLEASMARAGLDVERLTAWGVPFGRLYDRAVQRPALRSRGRARGVAARLGRSPAIDRIWRGLFAVDARLEGLVARVPWLRARASGLLAVGRLRGESGEPMEGTDGWTVREEANVPKVNHT